MQKSPCEQKRLNAMLNDLLKYYITLCTGSSLDLCKGTSVRTEPQSAWTRFQDRYPEGLHCGKMLCATAGGWGWGDGCWKTKWLAGKRGGNLGFLGLCQSSPADRMATAEGACCEGGFSFLLKGKRGDTPTTPTALDRIFLLPVLIASRGLFNSCFHPVCAIVIPSLHTHSLIPVFISLWGFHEDTHAFPSSLL